MNVPKQVLSVCGASFIVAGAIGCAAVPTAAPRTDVGVMPPVGVHQAARPSVIAAGVVPASGELPRPRAVPEAPAPASLGLSELTALGLERNPRLAQARFAIDTASGRALQAGLYPNPTVAVTGDELGDRQGPAGIITAPQVTQEIVTGGKLKLSRAAATKEVDQATLALMAQRYALLANIRSAYFDAVTTQRRAEILSEVVKLAEQSVELTRKLLAAKQAARLDLVQLEVDLERLRADEAATRRELPAAYKRLSAVAGVSQLPVAAVTGTLEIPLPPYELERLHPYVLAVHPEVKSAVAGVERAQLLLRRAEAEPIPNVTVSTGYVRQNQNRSNDWMLGVSMPVPVWNRNQGNILSARGQLGEAIQEVGRVENELVERLSTAARDFAAARERAERYRTSILPKAQETYELAVEAYKGGQFEYLRVLQAQRALFEARLEYNRTLGEAWRAASVISGLTLEDQWPPVDAPTP